MVKFGDRLRTETAQIAKWLPPDAFIDYDLLKKLVEESCAKAPDTSPPLPPSDPVSPFMVPGDPACSDVADPTENREVSKVTVAYTAFDPRGEFFAQWDCELRKVRNAAEETLKGNLYCTAPCGPFRLQCRSTAMHPELADALFSCVELNREGLRKIVKKFDKNHPNDRSQERKRLKVFDEVMRSTINEIEYHGLFSQVQYKKGWTRTYVFFFLVVIALAMLVVLLSMQATKVQVVFALGLGAGFLTAWANAANDICNSVGTAVGSKALTLFQAVMWGTFFEIVGCMTLGPFVSKSIVKGILQAEDYQTTPDLYAFGMLCVLSGAGLTTLLATFYGFPISATHGIIGGLVAVGLAAKGTDSIGWEKLGLTAVGWVAAPLAGGIVAVSVFWLISATIYNAKNPARNAKRMFGFFLWICLTVNILFMFIKGPKFMRIKPVWLAVLVACGVGAVCVVVIALIHKLKTVMNLGSLGTMFAGCGPSGQHLEKIKRSLSLDEEDAPQSEKMLRSFSFRTYDEGGRVSVVASEDKVGRVPLTEKGGEEKAKDQLKEAATPEKVEDIKIHIDPEFAALREEAEKYFVPLLIVSAFSVACAHGGNDVGNAVGPLSAIMMVVADGTVSETPDIPFWAICYGSLGFAVGIITLGRLTIKTVGSKITELTPSKSFATQMGGAVAVLCSSALGLPVSTSHCLVGAVVGIGVFQTVTKTGNLNLAVLSRIVVAWGVTIPVSMIVALMIFLPFKHIFE